ncbi:MAG: GNAT family N-acetyltransferase [Pseudomonadota bacterium]
MTGGLQIQRLKGEAIVPYIMDLAKLRIEIFKSYPYLYVGNLEYEKKYLQTYVSCPESVMVLVTDNNQVVGASTAIPLQFEGEATKKPFIESDMSLDKIFYLGESVLLPAYRGRNIYKHFFQEREAAAKEYGSEITTFCAVERPADDTRRPVDFKPLDASWTHFGYTKHPELCAYYEWREIGEPTISAKPLIFWIKHL